MAFKPFDLGAVLQTAEAIKGAREQTTTERLRQQYLGQQMEGARQDREWQAQDRERQNQDRDRLMGKEKAQEVVVRSAQILQAPNPRQYVEQYEPDLVKNLTSNGVNWDDLQDDQLMEMVTAMQNKANQELGVMPAQPTPQLETIYGPSGSILQKDPTTGKLTNVRGPAAAGGSESAPANVREYQYYNSLNDDERAEYLRLKRGDVKPSSATEKRLFDMNDAAFKARSNVSRYNNIANEMLRVMPSSGVRASFEENLKRVVGSEDAVTVLRKEWNALRVSSAVQQLPPGVASDKDIQLVMSAFLPENANPEAVASFMRGLAKLEDIKADYHEFESDYLSRTGSVIGLGRAWREEAAIAYGRQSSEDDGGGASGGAPNGEQGRQGPAIGTVEGGYRFRGGNPADPASWEKM